MKRIITTSFYIISLFITCIGGLGVAQAAAQAAGSKAAVVAIIDSRRLFGESLVSKDIREQLMSLNNGLVTKENATKDGLLKEKDDLDKQKTVIAQEAYEAKYNVLKQKADKLNRDSEIHRQQMNVAQAKANEALQRVLQPIIGRVAEQKGATIVFEKSQLVWQREGLDITTEVIETLDKQMPTLKVVLPTEAEIMQMINQVQQQQGR
jgi:Skp family chaperone for outer membrane proteins